MPQHRDQLITGLDARAFFHGALTGAVERQSVVVQDETVIYLANLLTAFVRAEHLYDRTPEGVMIRPLAALYGDAVSAPSADDRRRALRKLGDVALFVSGLFSQSLSRSLVDVDYYIAMGGSAYDHLARSGSGGRTRGLREVFGELARQFKELVDVLAEIGEQTLPGTSHDMLRMYEIWLATGSPRTAAKLRDLGVDPVRLDRRTH